MRSLKLFAMGSGQRYISPYLLRPLRTLDEVLDGRGRAAGIEVIATCGNQSVRSRTALQNVRPASIGIAD
jgi:hypothetical protein